MTERVLYVGSGVESRGPGALESHFDVDVVEGAVDAIKRLSDGSRGTDSIVVGASLPDLTLDEFVARVRQHAPDVSVVVLGPLPEEPPAAMAVVDADAYVPPGREDSLPDHVRDALSSRRIERAVDRHARLTRAIASLAVDLDRAEDRAGIEQSVYDALVEFDVYEQVWVARVGDGETLDVTIPVPGRLTDADLRDVAGPEGPDFAAEAIDRGRVVASDGPAPTRSAAAVTPETAVESGALRGGLESAIVPFVHEGRVLGVALVSTSMADAFDASERKRLADLGAVVGRALRAVDSTGDDRPAENDRMGTLVHELRNPLGIARSHLEIAREDGSERSFDHVASALERMDDTIDRVAAGVVGGDVVESTAVDLHDVTEEAWDAVSAPDASLELLESCRIRADRAMVIRLLTNLLQNAVDHAGERVSVRVGPTDQGFFVEDDGPGIPPEDRESVFARGYTTADDGLGLGLSIVQGVVDAHDWTLSVSEADSGGTRFEVGGVRTVAEDAIEGHESR